jgi:hypothetical protein
MPSSSSFPPANFPTALNANAATINVEMMIPAQTILVSELDVFGLSSETMM